MAMEASHPFVSFVFLLILVVCFYICVLVALHLLDVSFFLITLSPVCVALSLFLQVDVTIILFILFVLLLSWKWKYFVFILLIFFINL
jgi:hypothetical protein